MPPAAVHFTDHAMLRIRERACCFRKTSTEDLKRMVRDGIASSVVVAQTTKSRLIIAAHVGAVHVVYLVIKRHPSGTDVITCLTDVMVNDLLATQNKCRSQAFRYYGRGIAGRSSPRRSGKRNRQQYDEDDE